MLACLNTREQWRQDGQAWYRYRETKHNNLSYWGLDYPPLSAYQVRLIPQEDLYNFRTHVELVASSAGDLKIGAFHAGVFPAELAIRESARAL